MTGFDYTNARVIKPDFGGWHLDSDLTLCPPTPVKGVSDADAG